MAQRGIGIEITDSMVRVAIAQQQPEQAAEFVLLQRPLESGAATAAVVADMLVDQVDFADRCCLVLADNSGFERRLLFPFADGRKIAAAARMEISAMVPAPTTDQVLALSPPCAAGDGFAVTVVSAVPQQVEDALLPFDDSRTPLHVLSLTPYAEADALRFCFTDGVLVRAHNGCLAVAAVQDGAVNAVLRYRCHDDDEEALCRRICRAALLLARADGVDCSVCLCGGDISAAVEQKLVEHGFTAYRPPFICDGAPVPAADMPVCCAALAAHNASINLRSGVFRLKSEWAFLRRHFYIGAAMLVLALLIVVGGAWRNYTRKAELAQRYRSEINQIFRQTFPDEPVIVDAPRQMAAALEQMRSTGHLLGLDRNTSALAVLRAVSAHIPAEIPLVVKRFNYSARAVVISGETDSFDSVNRMAGELGKVPEFGKVRIADANMSVSGHRVNFTIKITMAGAGEGDDAR